MLFRKDVLDRIAAGEITLAFRRWKRPTVRPGGRLRTRAGELAILDVQVVDPGAVTDADARAAGHASRAALFDGLPPDEGRALYRVAFRFAGEDARVALRNDAALGADEFAALQAGVAALDRRAPTPWAMPCLRLIAAHEGLAAARLADRLGMEKPVLKRRIRQLKELGLTESLEVGYRLSPRGRSFLAALERS